ncbi:uncharacterized protein PAC_15564 [Phialocephala subalpina]|uniref:Uncharacterized protein n=1 Tax=Phialocephala subalpina TaxID=576137 RepID=A0A1L7XKX9_9HELO|nr:uncharacterized protein PAC_15564 [Phialocephala subalpina]
MDTQIAGDLLKMMLSIRMLCYDFARSSDAFRLDLLDLLYAHLSGAWPETRDDKSFDPYYRNNLIRFDTYFRCFHRITAEDLANEIFVQESDLMSYEDPDQSRICLRPCSCCAGNFSLAELPECSKDPTPKHIFDAYNEKTPQCQCRSLVIGRASSRLVFSVPFETGPGDILVNFHTIEADLHYQLFFVCTPKPGGAQEFEILGPATHMTKDDSHLPLVSATAVCNFSSNAEWKKDLGCRAFIRKENWLVMSMLGQNMLEFVKLLSTKLIDKPGFMLDLP